MNTASPDFESLRANINALATPSEGQRTLFWFANGLGGVAKTANGGFEIFIAGSAITARSRVVRRHLEHNSWIEAGAAEPFEANRVVLPSAPHFASLAALIAIELMRV